MKINQLFFLITTCFAILPMNVKANDKPQFPSVIRTGLDTPMSRLRTTSEYRQDFSQVVNQLNQRSETEVADASKRAIETLHELQRNQARSFVYKEILDFIPIELLMDIDFKDGDDPITLSQKQYRLGLKIIGYCNLLPDYILAMIRDNRELVDHNVREGNFEEIKKFVDGFNLSGIALPNPIKEICTDFMFHNNPTPAMLKEQFRTYKNKYVALQFIKAAKLAEDNINLIEPAQQSDALFSAALVYKWAGDRLEANWLKAHPNSSDPKTVPPYYAYYVKSLKLHQQAMDRLAFADEKFKDNYVKTLAKGISWMFDPLQPFSKSEEFLIDPKSVLRKVLPIAS